MNRNNVIYNWQFNRNPLIDMPDLVDYICHYAFNEIQIAREDIYNNIGILRMFIPFMKLNAIAIKPSDKLNSKIVSKLRDPEYLNELTKNIFVSKDKIDNILPYPHESHLSIHLKSILRVHY